MHTYTHRHAHTYTHIHAGTHTHTYIHTYTDMHTYTHAYMGIRHLVFPLNHRADVRKLTTPPFAIARTLGTPPSGATPMWVVAITSCDLPSRVRSVTPSPPHHPSARHLLAGGWHAPDQSPGRAPAKPRQTKSCIVSVGPVSGARRCRYRGH